MDDFEYYQNVPYPGGRIVDRVPVGGVEQSWPSNFIRHVMRRWLGPVHLQTQGVEFTVRYVGVHDHQKKGAYPLHTHPHSEMIFTLDGNGIFHVPDRNANEQCVPGQLVVMPPGKAHQSQWNLKGGKNTWRVLVVNFDIAIDMSQCPVNSKDVNDMAFTPFYEWFFIKQGGSIQIGEPELPAVNSSLREVAETISNRQYGVCTDVVTGLMKSISLISRHIRRMGLADGTNIASPVISKMSALQKAKSLMEHGFQDAGCVVDVARSVGMSESHFIRAFKHAFGATPKKFSLDVQMRRAAALLVETDIKVKNASDFLGYTDPSSFSRAFTRFHGISPTEFQQTMLIKRQAGM